MTDPETNYEEAHNAADMIDHDGFYALVTQEDEIRWPAIGRAFRAVGLIEYADVFEDFIRLDGEKLAAQSSLPIGSPEFVPSKDWAAEFTAILSRNGGSYVGDKLEDFRILHGLEEL